MDNQTDISGLITSLMGDEKFSALLNTLKSSVTETSGTESTANPSESSGVKLPDNISDIISNLSTLNIKPSESSTPSRSSDRKKLLMALRPFMSVKRQAAIDGLIGLTGFADFLK